MKELMNKKGNEDFTVKESMEVMVLYMAATTATALAVGAIGFAGCAAVRAVIDNKDEIKARFNRFKNRITRKEAKEERVPKAEFEEVEKEYTFD